MEKIKKFGEYGMISESIQPYYTLSKSQLCRLVFEVYEKAKSKEEMWEIIDEQIMVFETENKIKPSCPDGAFF